MKEKKYTLTISILASNRKDTLPKTLESIKPILEQVSSELIVTDTGCDEELLEIIRRYTDKIVKFEWCKDFSKARNVGLDIAQGQWFMYIDDDEWFEDASEIIKFFNSRELEQFGYGQYIVRNYRDFEGKSWSESIAGRIFRINDGTKFKNAIHETPSNIMGPAKNFSAYVHHYGYVYKSDEERKKHYERNVGLLLKQVDEESNVARHYAHLAQEYSSAREYEKVIDIAYKGIGNADMTRQEAKNNVPGLYAFVISALERLGRYEELAQRAVQFMESPCCNALCEAMLSGFCATAACNLGKYEESIQYAYRFFELREYFEINPEEMYRQSTAMLLHALEEGNSANVAYAGMLAASAIKRLDDLERFVDKRICFECDLGADISKCINNIISMMCEEEYTERYVVVIENVIKNRHQEEVLLQAIKVLKEKDEYSFLKMAGIVGLTSSKHEYAQYLRIISRFKQVSREELTSWYRQAIRVSSDLMKMEHEFWIIATKSGINIQSMVDEIPMHKWMVCVETWSANVKIKELIEKKQDLDRVLKEDCIHMRFFNMLFIEALLFRKKLETIGYEELRAEMECYADEVIDFYGHVYTEIALKIYTTILPNRCQIAIIFRGLLSDQIKYTEEIKGSVLKYIPRLGKIMDKYEEFMREGIV